MNPTDGTEAYYPASGYTTARPIDPRLIRSPITNEISSSSSSSLSTAGLPDPTSSSMTTLQRSTASYEQNNLVDMEITPYTDIPPYSNPSVSAYGSSIQNELIPYTYSSSSTILPTTGGSKTAAIVGGDGQLVYYHPDNNNNMYDTSITTYPHTIIPSSLSSATVDPRSIPDNYSIIHHHHPHPHQPPPSDPNDNPEFDMTLTGNNPLPSRVYSSSSVSSSSSINNNTISMIASTVPTKSSVVPPTRPVKSVVPSSLHPASSSASSAKTNKNGPSSASHTAVRVKGYTAKDLAKLKVNSDQSKSSISVDTDIRSDSYANFNSPSPHFPLTTLVRSVSEILDRYPNFFIPGDCSHVVSNWIHTIPVPMDRLRNLVTPQTNPTTSTGNTTVTKQTLTSTSASSLSLPRIIDGGGPVSDTLSNSGSKPHNSSGLLQQHFQSLYSLDIERIQVPTVSDRWRKTVAYNDTTTASGKIGESSAIFSDDTEGFGRPIPMKFNVRLSFFSTPDHTDQNYIPSLASVKTSFSLADIRIVLGRKESITNFIGGPWSATEDGGNPLLDDSCLVRAGIRHANSQTGIDLSLCTNWVKVLTIHYRRNDVTINNVRYPEIMEVNTLFLVLDVGKGTKLYREVSDNSPELNGANIKTNFLTVYKGKRTMWESLPSNKAARTVASKFPPSFGSPVPTSILGHNATSIEAPLPYPCIRLLATPSFGPVITGNSRSTDVSQPTYVYYRIFSIQELHEYFRHTTHFYDSEEMFEVALFVEAIYELFVRDAVHIINLSLELVRRGDQMVEKNKDERNSSFPSKKIKRENAGEGASPVSSSSFPKIPFFSQKNYHKFYMNEVYSALNVLNYGDDGIINLKELHRLHHYAGLRFSDNVLRSLVMDVIPRDLMYKEPVVLNLKRVVRNLHQHMDAFD